MLERNTSETEEINLKSKQKVHKTFLVKLLNLLNENKRKKSFKILEKATESK